MLRLTEQAVPAHSRQASKHYRQGLQNQSRFNLKKGKKEKQHTAPDRAAIFENNYFADALFVCAGEYGDLPRC